MKQRLLLCTDLDRTLIDNGPQVASAQSRRYFDHLVSHPQIILAFVSGRDRVLVEQAIEEYKLPMPDYVIGDVGTSLYYVGEERSWVLETLWSERIASDWGMSGETLAAHLTGLEELTLQEIEKQNTYKLSFYVSLGVNQQALSTAINQRLHEHNIQANLIWSEDELKGIGLLDILPASASKFHAIEALMELRGFSNSDTVFCGDSGNDLEVLVSHIPSVLVANAQDVVRQRAITEAKQAGNETSLYIAQGDFLGMNGNYSAGMLEGVAHFHPWTEMLYISEDS